MNFLMAFLIGGLICAFAQILMDVFKLLPIYITVLFVCAGSFLEAFNLYDKLIEIGHAGAMVPISSFGHSLTHAALEASVNDGYIGMLLGIFDLTAPGISAAILFAFIMSLVFKPKG
ncbi:MAG: stage V sporulation protein AE [Bacilli bacterium]|nr:stage V sporulation protein AE [Bacilli bacterium]